MNFKALAWWMGPALNDSILPLTIDFSTLPDGALPLQLSGATWAIVSGAAVNTPTEDGGELLTDGGLEANYTAGKCDTLSKGGSPVLAQSADVYSGSKAQEFTATAGNNILQFPSVVPTAHQYYQLLGYGKRTAGTGGNVSSVWYQPSGENRKSWSIAGANYTKFGVTTRTVNTNVIATQAAYEPGYGVLDTVIVDAFSLKKLTRSTLYASFNAGRADVVLKVRGSWDTSGLMGIIARADSLTNPLNFISISWTPDQRYGYLILDKWINGQVTNVAVILVTVLVLPSSTLDLELRLSGSTVQVFYGGVQKGVNYTISDAAILNNKIHGMLASGGSQITRFFCTSQLTPFSVGAFGSSLTEPATGYAALTKDWIIAEYPRYDVGWLNQARGGNWPWSNLVRYPANLGATNMDIVFCDYRAVSAGREMKSLEVLTRKIYTDNPNAVIISPTFPGDDNLDGVVDDNNQVQLDSIAMGEYYGVHFVDYRQEVIGRVTGGESLTVYLADAIHPTVAGQSLCASMIETAIVANGWLNPENHATLPARLYDDGDYEREPTRIFGAAYDSITGTGWTTTGTQIESSTAGDTVTYTVACQSFGIYNAAAGYTSDQVDIRIDGGNWQLNQYISHNGSYIELSYSPHTIELRVRAGDALRIDEFWAI